MLTIENTHKLLYSKIHKNREFEYYVFNTTEFSHAYQIHLRCPKRLKSDQLLVLLRTANTIGNPNQLTGIQYVMYDNSNPMNRIYVDNRAISDMRKFITAIEFLVNKYILC